MQLPTFHVPLGNKRKRHRIEKKVKKTVTRKCPIWDGRYHRASPTQFRNRGWIKDSDIKLELIFASKLVSRIRILGNKVFQLYLRLCVEKFNATKDDAQLAVDTKITQNMIQHAYQAIKTGSIKGNVPEPLHIAFDQFKNLPGAAEQLARIKADAKYREAYLTELLKADAQKMYNNWRTFVVKNVGIYLKQWAAVKIDENRVNLPGVAANHKIVVATAAMVRNAVLRYSNADINLRLDSETLQILRADDRHGEREFLQGCVNRCRDVLSDAGVAEFPIRYYSTNTEEGDEEDEAAAASDDEGETPGFKDDLALRTLPLLYMIIKEMNDHAAASQAEFREHPVQQKRRKRFIERSKNPRKPEEWFLNGPFNRPLFPEAAYNRVFVKVGMLALVELRKSLQRRAKKIEKFQDDKTPYVYTPSLVGLSIAITCYGIPATFTVGENSGANRVQIADPGEIDTLSISVVKIESREDAEPASLLGKIDQIVDQPDDSSFKFSTEEYKKQSGFKESTVRYDEDLQNPQYAALRAYFGTGSSPRVVESTAYKQHIETLMPVFDSLCRLHLHRNRVASRFKSERTHQRALDSISNDIMRGQNTMNWPKGTKKPPRQNTVLCHGLSVQTRALKGHQNAPHHRLLRVLCRRRSRNEPVLLVFFVEEAGSSKYCCKCSAELAVMDAHRMRACTNVNCPISINEINRDRSSSIILMRFGVWAMFDVPRPPPFRQT